MKTLGAAARNLLILVFASSIATTQFAPQPYPTAPEIRSREDWFMRGRTAQPGNVSAKLRQRAHQTKLRNRHSGNWLPASPSSASVASGWQTLGPAPLASDSTGQGWQDYGPVSGRVTAVVIDPADTKANTVYVGGAYGGLWRSQNAASGSWGNTAGVTWTPLTDNQPTLAVGAIALQPGNVSGNLSNLILIGTGEANASGDSYYGLGFLRSTDHGNSWTLISSADAGTHPLEGMAIGKIVFSSAQKNTVVAGVGFSTSGEIQGADDLTTTPHGIYYSTDAGSTWHLATVQDSAVAIAPDSPRGIVFNPATAKFYAAIRKHGFYSSADGITWSRLANQPGAGVLTTANCPPNPPSVTCPIVRGELAVVAGRNEMYAWFTDFNLASTPHDVNLGIWKSTDGGSSWVSISTTGIDDCGDIIGGCGTENGEYNLSLNAVPNGTVTDLYAGAVNIFKCTVSGGNPTCSASPFLNLTHAFGCPPNFGSIAHVHPAQHAADSMLVNGNTQNVMYFGNDGGVYRSLDAYTGLTTGSCGGTNQFDSLNGTIGSLTQFVSLSQHPTNPDVLLGGTHGNGSPATSSATTTLSWTNVNNGDGAFTALDHSRPASWFTSHPDVGNGHLAIEHCALGIGCHAQDFASDLVVTSYDLNGDDGSYDFPYILDPQDSSQLLVGTCRVWQGPASGGTFSTLSHNFETGTPTTCTGSEVNTVTSISAGGPKTSAGSSKFVYATTSGFGPLTSILGLPAGGHVFLTTDSSTTLMTDVTGTINPIHYPLSAVAIDPSDANGQTAFVTVMGFGTPHVYKTNNAGVTWANFTGSGSTQLPDCPVNTVVVDGSAGMVYVGTDVGVFGSPTSSPNWTEVGPTSGTGMLPNTAVLDLKLFNPAGLLRAATYGRGVWQINLVPGFQIAISNSPRTVFPSQQATFNGTLIAQGGYTSSVALSCTADTTPPPASCTSSPPTLTPTVTGAAFQVKASDQVGDYTFNVHGVGSDARHVTQNQSVTLHVVDFALSAPNPASVTANRPNSSNSTNLTVSASGSFNQTVQLACGGLPTGAACNFLPSATVSPLAGVPITVTLTISTRATTPTGSYAVTISGSTTNPAATRTQPLTLVVTALPDYVVIVSNSPQSAFANQTATFSGKLTAANGYSSPVNLSCGTGHPSTCTPLPATVTPTSGGASFSVTVKSGQAQNYSFDILAQGTDSSHVSHSTTVIFNSLLDFLVSASNSPQSVRPGQTAVFNLSVTPIGGTFQNLVILQTSSCPSHSVCSFNPPSISAGSGNTPVTFTITTAGPNVSFARSVTGRPVVFVWLATGLGMVLLSLFKAGRIHIAAIAPIMLLLIAPLLLLQACGGGASGGGGNPPPPTPVQVTISPTQISVPVSQSVRFVATVTGTSNRQVTWKVNNTVGGNSTVGTVNQNGLYQAPTAVPSPPVVSVTAVSQADQLKSASADVTIIAASISIAVSPASASVFTNGKRQFTATVTGTRDSKVTWNVNGTVGGSSSKGFIDSSGLYTAPPSVPTPASVTVGAAAHADSTRSAAATVSILPSTPVNTYPMTITATSGSLTRTANITLNVVP